MYRIINDKRAIASKKKIYQSLAEIIKTKNFEDVTVTEVVKRAGVARSTFYRNFDNLHDVLKLAADTAFSGLYEYVLVYYQDVDNNGSAKPVNFLQPFLEYWYEDSEVFETLIRGQSFGLLFNKLAGTMEKLIELSTPQQGVITEHKNYYLAIRISLSFSILVTWIRNGKDIPPKELAEIISQQVEESIKQEILI